MVGKTASCAAMALTVGVYAWPAYAHEVAVVAVVALTAINYVGVHKSARLTRVIVVTVLAVLAAVVVAVLGSGAALPARLALDSSVSVGGVLQAAGLLFFAFAGYARIATLAEEVRDPARVIPRAILIALAIALGVYAVVAVAVMAALGPDRLAMSAAPLVGCGAGGRGGVAGSGGQCRRRGGGPGRHCSHSSWAYRARCWRWPATVTCRRRWPPCTRGSRCRTGPNWRSVPWWRCWPASPISGGRSDFRRSRYWCTTRSPMHRRSRCGPPKGRRRGSIPVCGLAGCALLAVALPLPSVLAGSAVLLVGAIGYGVQAGIRRT